MGCIGDLLVLERDGRCGQLGDNPVLCYREHISVPQSLFWRKYTPDLLSTRIRKLSPQTKKVKARAEQFTPLLDGQVRERGEGGRGTVCRMCTCAVYPPVCAILVSWLHEFVLDV